MAMPSCKQFAMAKVQNRRRLAWGTGTISSTWVLFDFHACGSPGSIVQGRRDDPNRIEVAVELKGSRVQC